MLVTFPCIECQEPIRVSLTNDGFTKPRINAWAEPCGHPHNAKTVFEHVKHMLRRKGD